MGTCSSCRKTAPVPDLPTPPPPPATLDGPASAEAAFVRQDTDDLAAPPPVLAEGAQEEKTEESGPPPLQPFPVREHSANVFALLVRFLHIRQVAFGIWREELVDHFPALIEDGTDDPRVTLERATGRVFQDDTFECDHAKPYAPAAQQQNIFGDVVTDIDQLYEAARLAEDSFVAFMSSALSQVDTVDFEAHKDHWIAPLKTQTRAAAKAQNDYATRSPDPPKHGSTTSSAARSSASPSSRSSTSCAPSSRPSSAPRRLPGAAASSASRTDASTRRSAAAATS